MRVSVEALETLRKLADLERSQPAALMGAARRRRKPTKAEKLAARRRMAEALLAAQQRAPKAQRGPGRTAQAILSRIDRPRGTAKPGTVRGPGLKSIPALKTKLQAIRSKIQNTRLRTQALAQDYGPEDNYQTVAPSSQDFGPQDYTYEENLEPSESIQDDFFETSLPEESEDWPDEPDLYGDFEEPIAEDIWESEE